MNVTTTLSTAVNSQILVHHVTCTLLATYGLCNIANILLTDLHRTYKLSHRLIAIWTNCFEELQRIICVTINDIHSNRRIDMVLE